MRWQILGALFWLLVLPPLDIALVMVVVAAMMTSWLPPHHTQVDALA